MLPLRSLLKDDRNSWEVGTKNDTAEKIKKKLLNDKIEKSKKKSLEVLMRLKAMKLRT
jgi:hypothetical protein